MNDDMNEKLLKLFDSYLSKWNDDMNENFIEIVIDFYVRKFILVVYIYFMNIFINVNLKLLKSQIFYAAGQMLV